MTAAKAPLSEAEAAELFAAGADASGLLLAVSGGPDSVALMRLMARWLQNGRPPVAVATVDHGLRAESRTEVEQVGAWAAALGLPHAILTWTQPTHARLQEAARAARYRLLAEHARSIGASHVVTAHHQEDQAETVLMRLAAGTGPSGLAGIRTVRQQDGIVLWRPLLDVARARLRASLGDHPVLQDPSNADDRFARARLRASAAVLAREGLTPARLSALARRMQRVDAALAILVAAARARHGAAGEGGWQFAPTVWSEPDEVLLRLIVTSLPEAESVRLQRAERLLSDLVGAARNGLALRRTLGGGIVSLSRLGHVTIGREAHRKTIRGGPDFRKP